MVVRIVSGCIILLAGAVGGGVDESFTQPGYTNASRASASVVW